MRIIKTTVLSEYYKNKPQAKMALISWVSEVKQANWKTPQDIKNAFPKASIIANNRVIFDIGGGNYRLIVAVAYSLGVVYIKFIGTHKEYDAVNAAKVSLK